MNLFPHLPRFIADRLIKKLAKQTIEEAFNASGVKHPTAIYNPTGGNRVKEEFLTQIQGEIREAARQAGYPEAPNDQKRREFDAQSGRILHERMNITPTEASNPGIWMFLTCILLPDIVRWRFPGTGETNPNRFHSGVRNTFGRVWWRAHILYQSEHEAPYELLTLLGEDELVQIMERPNIAGSPVLARHICQSFIKISNQNKGVTRSDLLRDAMKRIRRFLPLVSFDALDDNVIRELIDEIFIASVTSLKARNRASA